MTWPSAVTKQGTRCISLYKLSPRIKAGARVENNPTQETRKGPFRQLLGLSLIRVGQRCSANWHVRCSGWHMAKGISGCDT